MKKDLRKKALALTAAFVVAAGMTAPAATAGGRVCAGTESRSAEGVSSSSDEQALKEAKKAYKAADQEYQQLGFEFVDSRTSGSSSFASIKSAIASSSVSEYADSSMDDAVASALKSDNIKKSIKLIRELNRLRARSDNAYGSVAPVKVDFDLMMYSAFSGYISEQTHNHTLFESGAGCPANLFSECLAWGYSDPFDGWYTEEKKIYDSDPNSSYSSVGHYLNSVSPDAEAVGLTYSEGTSAMDMGTIGSTSVTLDEFETAFTEYTGDAAEKRDAAKAEYDRIYKAYWKRRSVGRVTQKKPLSGKASFTVRWKRVKKADGYQIRYYRSYYRQKKVWVKGGSRTSKKIRKIRRKQAYAVQVRAYRVVDGKKFYGRWSSTKYGYGW